MSTLYYLIEYLHFPIGKEVGFNKNLLSNINPWEYHMYCLLPFDRGSTVHIYRLVALQPNPSGQGDEL